MDITLEKRAIVLKISQDSSNLKPLLYFVENTFKNVRYLTNTTIIHSTDEESVKKNYLLNWAYKIYFNMQKSSNHLSFKELTDSMHLPIYILSTNNKAIVKTATITIDHAIANELSVICNQYHSLIIPYLKIMLKQSLVEVTDTRTLKIIIKTKSDLLLLKNLLSYKKISNISVTFVTHGLNFNRLYSENNSEEALYKEKLKKSYRVLNITDNSTNVEIKNNYKRMLRKYHPDRVYNADNDLVKLYTRRFQVIQEAYQLIQEHHKVA